VVLLPAPRRTLRGGRALDEKGAAGPARWVTERSSESGRRNARAALIWHFGVSPEGRRTFVLTSITSRRRGGSEAYDAPGIRRCRLVFPHCAVGCLSRQ
jgi:hypothetical protein